VLEIAGWLKESFELGPSGSAAEAETIFFWSFDIAMASRFLHLLSEER